MDSPAKAFDSQRFRQLERLLVGCLASDDEERNKFADGMMTDHSSPDDVGREYSPDRTYNSSHKIVSSSDDVLHHGAVVDCEDNEGNCVTMEKKTEVTDLAQTIRGLSRQTRAELSSWGERWHYTDSSGGQLCTRRTFSRKVVKTHGEKVVNLSVGHCPSTPSVSTSNPLVSTGNSCTVSSSVVNEASVRKHDILSTPLIQLGNMINREDTTRRIKFRLHDNAQVCHPRSDDQEDDSLSCMTSTSSSSPYRRVLFGVDSSIEKPRRFAATARELSPANNTPQRTQSIAWTFVWTLVLLILLFPEYLGIPTQSSSPNQLLLPPGVTAPPDDRSTMVNSAVLQASETSTPATASTFSPQDRTVCKDLGEKRVSLPPRWGDLDNERPPTSQGRTKATFDETNDGCGTSRTNAAATRVTAEQPIVQRWMEQHRQHPILPCKTMHCRISRAWTRWRRTWMGKLRNSQHDMRGSCRVVPKAAK